MTFNKTGPCSLCDGDYTNYGNNPEPLLGFEERCCADCNQTKVIPARLRLMVARRHVEDVMQRATEVRRQRHR
jgi:hypothetical protein